MCSAGMTAACQGLKALAAQICIDPWHQRAAPSEAAVQQESSTNLRKGPVGNLLWPLATQPVRAGDHAA